MSAQQLNATSDADLMEKAIAMSSSDLVWFIRDVLHNRKEDWAEAADQWNQPTDVAKLLVIKKILE